MAVTEVSTSPYLSDNTQRTPTTELGKDDFLKLLITQMQYQDPLQPMDNNEYIAQMAQFSSLEQMTNISQEFSALKAFQLIGKNVTAKVQGLDTSSTESISGKVEKVIVDGSKVLLEVGGKQVELSDVSEVSSDDGGSN